jgi:uncharacterized protein (DUF2126 family)
MDHRRAGPVQRQRAVELLSRLRQRLRPTACCISDRESGVPVSRCRAGHLVATGARDGVPIWEDASLIAEDGKDYGYTAENARQFLDALTRRLQVDAAFTIAAYEDVFYYLWKAESMSQPICHPAGTPTFRPTARAIPRRPRLGTQASQVLRVRRGRTLVPAE